MMADYALMASGMILRRSDNAWIPPDETNRDYIEYQAWCRAGNTPDPAEPPPPGMTIMPPSL
jgi:hypothetical protein